jgi:hypothetical protein
MRDATIVWLHSQWLGVGYAQRRMHHGNGSRIVCGTFAAHGCDKSCFVRYFCNGCSGQVVVYIGYGSQDSDLKSLGACPRDGSSPSSGASNYSMLRRQLKVTFLFENERCSHFVSRVISNLVRGCSQVLKFRR